MSNSLLTLGPFSFEGIESPELIHLTSKQRLAVHHLGSGLSSIDYLGDDYQTISFRGVFSGTGAKDRIRSVDYLRLQGAPLILSWNSKTLSVIIQKFELDYSSDYWVPYRLSCYVVRWANAGTEYPTDATLASPGAQVSELFGLLDGTGVNPTSDQSDALLTLATLNFDVPPAVALAPAQGLVGSIGDQLARVIDNLQADTEAVEGSPTEAAANLAALVADYGQQIALTLGLNRVVSVITSAENVNQQ